MLENVARLFDLRLMRMRELRIPALCWALSRKLSDGSCRYHAGCEDLLHAVVRVRPRVVISGHIHENNGWFNLDGNGSE